MPKKPEFTQQQLLALASEEGEYMNALEKDANTLKKAELIDRIHTHINGLSKKGLVELYMHIKYPQ
jgi:hypothetical protein